MIWNFIIAITFHGFSLFLSFFFFFAFFVPLFFGGIFLTFWTIFFIIVIEFTFRSHFKWIKWLFVFYLISYCLTQLQLHLISIIVTFKLQKRQGTIYLGFIQPYACFSCLLFFYWSYFKFSFAVTSKMYDGSLLPFLSYS